MDETEFDLIAVTANIVAAYVSHNTLVAENLPNFIASVHGALSNASLRGAEKPQVELVPAVPIKKSVTPDYIICLEDGKKFKSLKRHLRTRYNMSPQQYREKWGLAHDYPMVAPMYAAARSELAKTMGLGQRRQVDVAPAPVVVTTSSNSKGGAGKRGRAAGARK
jgi:predicted transcriptional regulator